MNAKLEQALECDMLVTSAGVSKGDYDMVKDVLAQHGSIDFWSVRMRPGQAAGLWRANARDGRRVPHLGLPGNPVSALVAFEQFGRPAIRKMLGLSDVGKPTVEAVLDEPIENPDGRRVYARAVVTRHNGGYRARLTGDQGSNLLTSMGAGQRPRHLSRGRAPHGGRRGRTNSDVGLAGGSVLRVTRGRSVQRGGNRPAK